jgi:tetratricopeptide (TPR) repeat protein
MESLEVARHDRYQMLEVPMPAPISPLGFPRNSAFPPVRVVVIGNSNAVMLSSFARVLGQDNPDMDVTIRSIGGSPNIILLEFLAHEPDFEYDFVIVETAVVDFLLEASYPRARSGETLELFVQQVRSRSSAKIIFLTIPARGALLAPIGLHWQESLYREIAAKFSIPILDGFHLVRQLVGQPKMDRCDLFVKRAGRLVSSFRLPRHLQGTLAWNSLRDRDFASNALGVFGMRDYAHFAPAMHGLIGALLRQFILSDPPVQPKAMENRKTAPDAIRESAPSGGRSVTRSSSLLSRDLVSLSAGEVVRYECPPGYRAFGIMLNAASTSCALRFRSPSGDTTLDLPFGREAFGWVARVVPVLDPIGGGDIEVTISGNAELGALILVRTDWRDTVPVSKVETIDAGNIEAAPWAKELIADAVSRARAAAHDIELAGKIPDKDCSEFIASLLAKTSPSSYADRARIMLVLGTTDGLSDFLDTVCTQRPSDAELNEMRACWRDVRAEDGVAPRDLLARAMDLAKAGAVDNADDLLAEGMARFMGRSEFFRESALIPTRLKDWPKAQYRWALFQRFFPKITDGYVWQSFSLLEMGRIDEATMLVAEAVDSFPNDVSLKLHWAGIADRVGDWAAAAERWDQVRARHPGEERAFYHAMRARLKLGEIDQAEQTANEAVGLFHDRIEILMLAGEIAVRGGDTVGAAERFSAAYALDPQHVGAAKRHSEAEARMLRETVRTS